jgi:hypothetical protein
VAFKRSTQFSGVNSRSGAPNQHQRSVDRQKRIPQLMIGSLVVQRLDDILCDAHPLFVATRTMRV